MAKFDDPAEDTDVVAVAVVVPVVVVAVVPVDDFDDLENGLIETAWISNWWQRQKSFRSLCF